MIKFIKKYLLFIVLVFVSKGVYAIDNSQDFFNLTKPTIVQIDYSIKTNIDIPNFIFDYDTGIFSTTTKVSGFSSSTLEKKVKGNGFIASGDGLIATNSNLFTSSINEFYKNIAKNYLQNINKTPKDIGYENAHEKIFNYLLENSVISIKPEIKVINSKGSVYDGVIIYPEYSFKDNDNVGLLKINAENLPSVEFSDKKIYFGEKVYSIGYLILGNVFSETIFNEGIVNTVYEETYKVSIKKNEGLNGSPVFEDGGKVVGILTSSDSVISLSKSKIEDLLISKGVNLKPGLYSQYFLSGIYYLNNKQCENALGEFIKAKNVNIDFSVDEYVKNKIDLCNAMILSGESRDTFLDKIIFIVKNNLSNSYLWLTLFFIFIIILLMYKSFIKRFRRDEEVIKSILDQDNVDVVKKNKLDTKDLENESEKKEGFEIKPFDNVEKEVIKTPSSKLNFKPLEKVEVVPKVESPHAPVTPPNAIQPEQPTIVIAPFKTLSKPIRSMSSDTVEMKKDIRTDLPPQKKENLL